MVKDSNDNTFACRNCGHPYVAYPPQSGYKQALLKPCSEGHNIEQGYLCERCKERNILYWCPGHSTFAVTSGRF